MKWVDVGEPKIVRKQHALSVEEVRLLAGHLSQCIGFWNTKFQLGFRDSDRCGSVWQRDLGIDSHIL